MEGTERRRRRRKGKCIKGREKEKQKKLEERKGGRGGERGCLSSGQVQLTLNCLALELEHLNVPEGLEEWSMDGVPPPPESLFFSLLPADLVSSGFGLKKKRTKINIAKHGNQNNYTSPLNQHTEQPITNLLYCHSVVS